MLFVPAKQKPSLLAFANRNQLSIANRVDIWELLNESFLDTEFNAEHQKRTLALLKGNGVGTEETQQIRKDLEKLMLTWTALTWEWCCLGHYDVLENKRNSSREGLPDDFYWWTMEIALRNYNRSASA